MIIDYSQKMLCYVVGIPRIPELNSHGNLAISTVIAPDPKTALRTYLSREAPLQAKTILGYLQEKDPSLSAFAFRAPSRDTIKKSYTPAKLAEQNKHIAKSLATICERDPEEVLEAINELLV